MSTPIIASDKDTVFVTCHDPDLGKWFLEKHIGEVEDMNDIIRCSDCDKTARVLDGLYPYHQEMNHCKQHAGSEIQKQLPEFG